MKEFSFIDLLRDGTDFCEWCQYPCIDEDKYEMLILCITVQREFFSIYNLAYLFLGPQASGLTKSIMKIFEKLMEDIRQKAETVIDKSNRRVNELKNFGCSQLFLISQQIEESYLNKSF